MVPLHAYIETSNLIFLILSCAAGEKLFDYIKNYVKSVPNTPAREVNLENVFAEPKVKNLDAENNVKVGHNDSVGNERVRHNDSVGNERARHNDSVGNKGGHNEFVDNENVGQTSVSKQNVEHSDIVDNDNEQVGHSDSDNNARSSVDEIVLSSQKLLLNVDKALTDVKSHGDVTAVVVDNEINREVPSATPSINRVRNYLPQSKSVCSVPQQRTYIFNPRRKQRGVNMS